MKSLRSIAFNAKLPNEKLFMHLILNGYWEPLEFELPPAEGGWRRWIDTSLASPADIVDWKATPPVSGTSYRVRWGTLGGQCLSLMARDQNCLDYG